MAQQSQEETIRTREELGKEEAKGDGDRRVYKARGRTRAQCESEGKAHQRGSRPTAICPDKDANSGSERGELVYHQPLTQQWRDSFSPMLDFD